MIPQTHTHDYLPAEGMDTTWCMNPFIIYINKQEHLWKRNMCFKAQNNGKQNILVK